MKVILLNLDKFRNTHHLAISLVDFAPWFCEVCEQQVSIDTDLQISEEHTFACCILFALHPRDKYRCIYTDTKTSWSAYSR